MLENILVPLDGTPISEAALPYAVALAGRTGARLTLVRAAHVPTLTLNGPAAQLTVLNEAEVYLEQHAEALRAQGCNVSTGVPYGTDAADWIVEEVSLRDADIIVMGTHDRGGTDRWLHGSVAEHVVAHASVPVVLVRGAEGAHPVEHFDWRHPALIVPLDGSPLAEAALPTAIEVAAAMRGQLVLLSAVPAPGQLVAGLGAAIPMSEAEYDTLEAQAREYLRSVAERPELAAVAAEFSVRMGEPSAEIARAALERGAAGVVMATHGRTGFVRTMLGSVAGRVVHTCACPVILVRPPVGQPLGAPVAELTPTRSPVTT